MTLKNKSLTVKAFLTLAFCSLLIMGALRFFAPPEADLWDRWAKHDDKSELTVSHESWDQLLQRFVVNQEDGIALVRYAAFTDEDRRTLNDYVALLEKTAITRLTKDDQRAYWINMYNAVTVKVVLDHFPVKSIRDIDIASDVLANGPWKAKLVKVEGQELTLDDIEHRILRPIWQDPRTHYAINCGAISCPNLHNRAFTAANMDETLDTLTRGFVNHPRGIKVVDGEVHASKIFRWFQVDFGDNEEAVLDHVRTYASDELRESLENITSITSYHYDWALNLAPMQLARAKTKKPSQSSSSNQTAAKDKDPKTSKRVGNKPKGRKLISDTGS